MSSDESSVILINGSSLSSDYVSVTTINPISNSPPTSGSWVYYLYQYNPALNTNSYSQDVTIKISDSDSYSGIYLAVASCGGICGQNGTNYAFTTYSPNVSQNTAQGGIGGSGGGGQVFLSSSLNSQQLPINVSNLFYYNDAIPPGGNTDDYPTPQFTNSKTQLYTTIVFGNSVSVNDTSPTNPADNPTLPMCFFGQPGTNGNNATESNGYGIVGTSGNGGNGGSWNGTSGTNNSPITYSYNGFNYETVSGGGGGGAGFYGLLESSSSTGEVNLNTIDGYGTGGQSYYGAGADAYYFYKDQEQYFIPGCTGISFADGTSLLNYNNINNINTWTSGGECTQNLKSAVNTTENGNSSWVLLYMQLANNT